MPPITTRTKAVALGVLFLLAAASPATMALYVLLVFPVLLIRTSDHLWQDAPSPMLARVVILVGILFLVVPGSCFVLTGLDAMLLNALRWSWP